MPTENGEFIQLTEDEIYDRLETNLEDILGVTAEPGDIITAQLQAEAKTLAELQEESLQRVYYATYLQDATGQELDKIVDLIGLTRHPATSSTGTARFSRATPPASDYTIPRGAEIQTEGNDPIEFSTTEQAGLFFIDGFESNNLDNWEGDKNSFTISNKDGIVIDGNHSLEKPAVDNVLITTLETYNIGTTFDLDIYPQTNTSTSFQVAHQDASNYIEVDIDCSANNLRAREVVDGSTTQSNVTSVTIPTGQVSHVEIEWQLYGDLVFRLYETDSKNTEIGSVFLDDNKEWNSGAFGVKSSGSSSNSFIDNISTTATTVNIEAVDTGLDTNIAPNQIRTIKSSLAGIENVINHVATGDDKYQNTDFKPFVTGENREDDKDLRSRAFENTSIGGAATSTAIGTKIDQIDGVQSVKLFKNKTEGEKNGLPAHSFEAIVYGGEPKDIAEAIFYSSSIDSTDYGGAHGVEKSYEIDSDVLAKTETINWSRPTKLDLDLDLTLIVDDTYVGDTEIKSIIANYIGGTDTDGSFVPGIIAGEDVYEAVLKQQIVNPENTGVWEVDSLIIDSDGDGNHDGTDDTETLSNNAEVLQVDDSEVAQVNARDGSITITTTNK